MAAAGLITTAVSSYNEYSSGKKQSKELNKIASAQEAAGLSQSDAMMVTARSNAQRAARNAEGELGAARLDTASSNIAGDGSSHLRDRDLATRLQDEINNNANSALQNADNVRNQALIDAANTRNDAYAAKTTANSAITSGLGSLFKQSVDLHKSINKESNKKP